MKLLGDGLNAEAEWLDRIDRFQPRLPWVGGDLQTLRNTFVPGPDHLEADDRLSVRIDETTALSVAINHPKGPVHPPRAVLLVHGLGGDEGGTYMCAAARYFSARGWTTYRMNMRGAGPSRATSAPPYHAGLSSDLKLVVEAAAAHVGHAIAAMGFSLGGHQLLRLIATGEAPESLMAAVTVSAPLDLARSSHRVEALRNRLYRRYLASVLRDHLVDFDHDLVTADPQNLPSVMAIDDAIIAPVFGFQDAEDYYAQMSVHPHLGLLDRPTLALHADNDPWIDLAQYEAARWPKDVPAGALITRDGGHVGFHRRGSRVPWCLEASHSFFEHVTI